MHRLMNFNKCIPLCSHHPDQDTEPANIPGFLMLHSSQY